MRIALTGAMGWIGSAVVLYLRQQNREFMILEGDVRNPATFRVAGGFDRLIHLAGAMPLDFKTEFTTAWDVNLTGMRQALEACVAQGATLIFASSSGVYSRRAINAVGEDDRFVDPPEYYGQSKWLAEQLCRAYQRRFNFPVRILRIFNPYGPGQTAHLLTGYIVQQVLQGKPVELRHPKARRDFIHIQDIARAFFKATQPFQGLETINIGSGSACSVLELTQKLVALQPADIVLPLYGGPEAETVFADISTADRLLGWRPEISLDEGLQSCLNRLPPRESGP